MGSESFVKTDEQHRHPNGWELVALNDLVERGRPICYGILMPGRGHAGGVPVIKVKDIAGGKIDESSLLLTSPQLDEMYRRSRLRTGDLLMTIRGTTGRVALVPESLDQANITQDTARLSISNKDTRDFLYHSLQSHDMQRQIQNHTIGQAVQGINIEEVRKLTIPLPPVGEQRVITRALSACDKVIEFTQTVIAQTRTLKTALLQDLLTNGLPGRHSEFKRDLRLGRVPVDWKISQIQENAEVTQGIALGPHRKPRRNATPYLRVANVQMGFVDSNEIKYIEASDEEQTKYALRTGDVLIVEGHANIEDLGRAALVPSAVESMVFQNHLFRIRTNPDQLDARYLSYWINSSPGRTYFRIFGGTTSGLNTVGSSQIRTLRLPLPSVKEQHRICDVVESTDHRIRALVDGLTQLHELKSALSQSLLTGRVRVPTKGGECGET